MKRGAQMTLPHFNAAGIETIQPLCGDETYFGIVAMLNYLMKPFGPGHQYPVVGLAVHVADRDEVTMEIGCADKTPLFTDVHQAIIAFHNECAERPLSATYRFRLGEEDADEVLSVTIKPRLMAQSQAKRQRTPLKRTLSQKLIGLVWASGGDKAVVEETPWGAAKTHLALMETWVADKRVTGNDEIPENVARIVARYVCAGMRVRDTSWQIESIERLGRRHPSIPPGWLGTQKPCLDIYIGVRQDAALPIFDAVILDECVGHLRSDHNIRAKLGFRTEQDGLHLVAAIL